MSLETLIKPVKNGVADVAVLAETTKDALGSKDSSEHLVEWRRQAVRFAFNSALMAACGFMAVRSLNRMRQVSHNHHDWKLLDARLDAALEGSSNTSEATSMV